MNGLENFLVQELFRGDFNMLKNKCEVTDLSKYAEGKPLKKQKLTCFGQLKQALCGSCPCKVTEETNQEKLFKLGRKKLS